MASALDGRVRSRALSFQPGTERREGSGSAEEQTLGGPPPPLSAPTPGARGTAPLRGPPVSVSRRGHRPPALPFLRRRVRTGWECGQSGPGRAQRPGRRRRLGQGRRGSERRGRASGRHGLAAPRRTEGSSHPAPCRAAPHTIAARAARAPPSPSHAPRPAPPGERSRRLTCRPGGGGHCSPAATAARGHGGRWTPRPGPGEVAAPPLRRAPRPVRRRR